MHPRAREISSLLRLGQLTVGVSSSGPAEVCVVLGWVCWPPRPVILPCWHLVVVTSGVLTVGESLLRVAGGLGVGAALLSVASAVHLIQFLYLKLKIGKKIFLIIIKNIIFLIVIPIMISCRILMVKLIIPIIICRAIIDRVINIAPAIVVSPLLLLFTGK